MSLIDTDYTGASATRTYASSGGSYGSSAAEAHDADVAASTAVGYGSGTSSASETGMYDTSASTATATDFSSQLIKQTESHWSVSGTSVISAWGACLVGGVSLSPLAPLLAICVQLEHLPHGSSTTRKLDPLLTSTDNNSPHFFPLSDAQTPHLSSPIPPTRSQRAARAQIASTGQLSRLDPFVRP
jgi:hypothetical protein